MFKRILTGFAAAFAILAMACQSPLSSPTPGKETTVSSATNGSGKLSFSLKNNVSRTLAPDFDMNASKYALDGTGPNGLTVHATVSALTTNVLTITDLKFGVWSITVSALNAQGQLIGSGSKTVTVDQVDSPISEIVVDPIAGFGQLDLTLNWNVSDVSYPVVAAYLVGVGNVTYNVAVVTDPASAHLISTAIPTGYYTIVFQLYDNTTLTMGGVDIVRIVNGQTTVGTFTFDEINKASGALKLAVSLGGYPLFPVIGGATSPKPTSQTQTLSASLTGWAPADVVYVWFVNGQPLHVGATFDFDSTWKKGIYRIDLTAYSIDGQRAGSASKTIRVNDDPVPPVVNLVTNGDFSTGIAPWTSWGFDGGDGFLTFENEALVVNKTTLGPNFWNFQAINPTNIALVAGKTYRVSFVLKSQSNPQFVEAIVSENGTDVTSDGNAWGNHSSYLVQATSQSTFFSFTFTMPVNNPSARIAFNVGDTASPLTIDDVSIVEE